MNILLAEDDIDDCNFFKKALEELQLSFHLTTVHDGEQLMNYLDNNSNHLPDVIFLDLSMPRKTGFECLSEIKSNEKLKDLHVIMLSTSFPRDMKYEEDMIKLLLKIGANQFIRKPDEFLQLKQVILASLILMAEKNLLNGQNHKL